jgi:reprolysin-like metallo-peptidase family M12B/S-layer family protein
MKKRIRPRLTTSRNSFKSRTQILRFILFALCLAALGASLAFQRFGEAAASTIQTQTLSPDGVWQTIDQVSAAQALPINSLQSFSAVRLDRQALTDLLSKAPREFTDEAKTIEVVLSLPMPDGSFSRFRVEESPVMEPELAAQFPEIKTYKAQGIDDPAATARFDLTQLGFHAAILSVRGSVYIEPVAGSDQSLYVSFYKKDYQKEGEPFKCLVTGDLKGPGYAPVETTAEITNGGTLRTYRLALAATGEYSAVFGGTVPNALAAMTTTMNRVNGIYERDLAVRMVMVASEASIIYTNSSTDPYSNSSGGAMLSQNQTNLDLVIGAANYDIGHVFSTGGGGVAFLGVICESGFKARGVTGLSNPTGDVFAVDYVAHEMGHQFGANHTFNGITDNCGGGNRSSSAAYEPGSGSTIMAYAGICGSQNLQPNSDDYFHIKSLEEILGYLASGGTCAVSTATVNTPPTVDAGPSYTIPRSTPFKLTAAATDPNGDTLTYCWEEFDLGMSSPPDTDSSGPRPILRSFDPVAGQSRTFPKISDILNNVSTIGEVLPAITRTMTFRVTARDNRASAGGVNSDSTTLSVTSAAGPFSVTQPNSVLSWPSGSLQSISWAVANTNISPVNTPTVRILLSTDAGLSFPVLVAASTPNDGSHPFFVPNLPTSSARIKVEAVSNIFFDISNSNFTITQSCPASLDSFSQSFAANGGATTIQVTAAAGCNWTAISSDTTVVTVTSGGAGTGNGQVGLTVSANPTTNTRSATITIGSLTFTVLQGAAFLDVPQGHLFYNEIGKLSARGITVGCGGSNYCPEALVTREQMAVFIIRAMGDFNPPLPGSQRFADVPATNPFYAFIEQMAVRQITAGCGGGNYCPAAAVTREQMASFLIKALGVFNPALPTSQRYGDVPPTNPFYAFIDQMAALGITSGCSASPSLYCPTAGVTRGQMAVFLVRAFNL